MVQSSALNDGFTQYGTKATKRSDKGKRIGDVFLPQGRLAYHEMSSRDEDYQFAQIMSKTLDIKIKTLYPPQLRKVNKSKLTMVIDSIEYNVIKVDTDAAKKYLYFYLQEVGPIEQD